jgi:hypothetical protein
MSFVETRIHRELQSVPSATTAEFKRWFATRFQMGRQPRFNERSTLIACALQPITSPFVPGTLSGCYFIALRNVIQLSFSGRVQTALRPCKDRIELPRSMFIYASLLPAFDIANQSSVVIRGGKLIPNCFVHFADGTVCLLVPNIENAHTRLRSPPPRFIRQCSEHPPDSFEFGIHR